uniref:Uncharacterized protein n=1 Tax=Panagrolaimus sp. ES5 TaxID=591445 RepID=A0AC34F8Q7_9BILA
MATTQIDSENPEIIPTTSSSWFSNFDPAFPTTAFSLFTNVALANMFVYGVTGRARLAYISGAFTIPISLFVSLKAATEDFERWKKMRHLREKGLPVKLMPYPYKFDWEMHEIRLRQGKLERELKSADNLSGTTQN